MRVCVKKTGPYLGHPQAALCVHAAGAQRPGGGRAVRAVVVVVVEMGGRGGGVVLVVVVVVVVALVVAVFVLVLFLLVLLHELMTHDNEHAVSFLEFHTPPTLLNAFFPGHCRCLRTIAASSPLPTQV